jgi:hypothetical protein
MVTHCLLASMKAMGVSGPYHVTGTNFPIALLLGGEGLSKDQPPPHPLEPFRGREAVQAIRQINTGGGATLRAMSIREAGILRAVIR